MEKAATGACKKNQESITSRDEDTPPTRAPRTLKLDTDRAFFEWFGKIPSRLNDLAQTRIARYFKMSNKFTQEGLQYLTTSIGQTIDEEAARRTLWVLGSFEHRCADNRMTHLLCV